MRTVAYCGDYTALTTTQYGDKIYVDTRDTSLAPHLMLDGAWEPWVSNCMASLLREEAHAGCLFIDVGANFGWYTLLAARFGAAQILAFEPQEHVAALLRKTLDVNGPPWRTSLLQAACGERSGEAYLGSSVHEAGGARLVDYETPLSVPVTTLDERYTHRAPLADTRPVVVKIDVEGHEPEVILGAARLIEQRRPTFFIEHHRSPSHAVMLRSLLVRGYSIRHVQRTGHRGPPLPSYHDDVVLGFAESIGDAETLLCLPGK